MYSPGMCEFSPGTFASSLSPNGSFVDSKFPIKSACVWLTVSVWSCNGLENHPGYSKVAETDSTKLVTLTRNKRVETSDG